MLSIILPLCFDLFLHPRPIYSNPSTWPFLISHDPQAKQLLLYCDTISLTQSECTTKFLTPSNQPDTVPPTLVSFRAAATCVSQASLTSTRLQNMFNLDPSTMSLLAFSSSSSSSMEPPNLNWQQMSDSSYWRATYSTQAREAAGKAAQDAYASYVRGIRELEKIPSWAKPLMDKHDKAAEKSFELGKMLADAAAVEWGVGADKYRAAYNDPWTVGVRPDLACPADSAGCLARKEGGAIDVVPSPEAKGSNTLEGPSGDGDRNEEDPTEKNEWPEGMDEDPDLTEPIINDDEEVHIDLEGELEATPILKDETTRTAMQKCQEREEKKLWDEIGSTTIDPNAGSLTEEEKRAEAEFYKRLGFCDKSYYGEKGCREWKRQLDSVPMPPDTKMELESHLQSQLDLCPVNLVQLTDCQRAKESVYMRFAILDETAQAVDTKFQPGRPVDVVPRLDFLVPGRNVTASMGGLQVRPLEEEKSPSTNENLKFDSVSIPRLPGQAAPKPSTPPAKEVPRLPFDVKAFDITPSITGSDDPRIPTWDLPGEELPRIPGAPGHKVSQDQGFNPPAIGGHTLPPFRLPPQA
ncbi:MAG: hypothetical protein L6R36_009305 [Xanthoria steineri]|nr:MAG: hypothetical protein L6R36_009305 [Xanthoria steineri]